MSVTRNLLFLPNMCDKISISTAKVLKIFYFVIFLIEKITKWLDFCFL